MADMTPAVLRDLCKKNGGYTQPRLNDQLFLQCQGFARIENLEPYTEAKVLWLEQNALDQISGLNEQRKLVSLFVHNNVIRTISGLQCLVNLRILNVSHNYLTRIENIQEYCPLLETLQISHNRITNLEDSCGELLKFKHLSSVDLSFNKIDRDADEVLVVMPPEEETIEPVKKGGIEILDDDEEEEEQEGKEVGKSQLSPSKGTASNYNPSMDPTIVVGFFKQMPELSVLYMQGNPLVHGLRHYRKQMVAQIPALTYLDERPVFPEERRATEAWAVGGIDAEGEERHKIRKEKHDHLTACVNNLAKMAESTKELRAQRTKEYEEKRDAARKEADQKRAALKRLTSAIEDDEDDARIVNQYEESASWVDLCVSLGDTLRQAQSDDEARQAAAAETRRMQAIVDADVAKEDARIEEIAGLGADGESMMRRMMEAHAHRNEEAVRTLSEDPDVLKAKEEMRFWVRQMELTDEEVVGQMETDMLDMLRTMTPGSTMARPSAENPTTTNSNISSSSSVVAARYVDPVAASQQGQLEGGAIDALPKSASPTPKSMFSKERVWEQYDRWEQAARKRFPAQRQ